MVLLLSTYHHLSNCCHTIDELAYLHSVTSEYNQLAWDSHIVLYSEVVCSLEVKMYYREETSKCAISRAVFFYCVNYSE